MRNPLASTKPSLNASCTCVTIASPNDNSRLNIANVRQYVLPEECERIHQKAQITGTRDLEHQVDDPSPDLLAAAFDLLDDGIRPADEICRKPAADGGRPRFTGDVARVELEQSLADAGAQREGIPGGPLRFEQVLGFLVGLGQEDVRPVDDVVRRRLPAVLRTCLTEIAGGSAHHFERAIGDTEAEMMACCELAGFTTGAEGIGRRMRLLQRARPHRDRAKLKVPALPAEGLRLGPCLENQLHPLGGALARLPGIETVAQVLAGCAAQ